MKVPLILKEVETRTEDPSERELISQILEIEENSIREYNELVILYIIITNNNNTLTYLCK